MEGPLKWEWSLSGKRSPGAPACNPRGGPGCRLPWGQHREQLEPRTRWCLGPTGSAIPSKQRPRAEIREYRGRDQKEDSLFQNPDPNHK